MRNKFFVVLLTCSWVLFFNTSFALFSVSVKNETNISFSRISIVTQSVGFDANYGKFDIVNITPHETRISAIDCTSLTIPFTAEHLVVKVNDCNLDVMITANYPGGPLLIKDYTSIVQISRVIYPENQYSVLAFNSHHYASLQGIQPPDMKIFFRQDYAGVEMEVEFNYI